MILLDHEEMDARTVKLLLEASYGKYSEANFQDIDKWDIQFLLHARKIAEFALKQDKEISTLNRKLADVEEELRCFDQAVESDKFR